MALKNQVLTRLIASRGVFLSGQTLAEEMNVTRGAIWKAVDALKADGYAVESVRNRGYSLIKSPDILRADEIVYLLLKGGEKADVLCFDSIDSTNAEARRRAGALTRPLLILSDTQTAGRGRSGHSFYSPKRTGLYMTVALPVSLSLKAAALSTQAMAVAAVRAAAETGGPELSIKWVNDLYLSGLKVAGILTEAVSDMETGEVTAVICGIGVNLTTEDFPAELAGVAGALGALDRNHLAARIALNFLTLARALPSAPWMGEYRAHSMLLGQKITFVQNGREYRAKAKTIDDEGRLIVSPDEGGEMVLASGEVSVRPADTSNK